MTQVVLEGAAGTDDGYYQLSGSSYANTGTTFVMVSGYGYWFRFPNPGIPLGSTIDAASLSLHFTASNAGTANFDIWANDVDAATHPTTAAAGQGLTLTTATVRYLYNWSSGVPGRIVATGLASVVQEVIDRVGYAENNAIMLAVEYWNGAGQGTVSTYEGTAGDRPRLIIDYTAPGGAGGSTLLLLGC